MPITNCTTYNNGKIAATACTRCVDSTFLNGSNACVARAKTKTITHCSVLAVGDDCTTCETGYFKVTTAAAVDSITCVLLPTNCITLSTAGACTACNHSISYFTTPTCTVGTIANCTKYHDTTNVCIDCTGERYWDTASSTCKDHTSILNCSTYSKTVANTCTNCDTKNFNFAISNKCREYPVIAHCTTFRTGYTLASLIKPCT